MTAIIQSLFLHQYFHRCFTLGMRMRSAIVAAVYKKVHVCIKHGLHEPATWSRRLYRDALGLEASPCNKALLNQGHDFTVCTTGHFYLCCLTEVEVCRVLVGTWLIRIPQLLLFPAHFLSLHPLSLTPSLPLSLPQALTLNNRSRRAKTVGEIVNLMSVDAQRFMDLMSYLHMIWSAPLQIVLALVFLYFTMGYAIFAGFVLMLLMIPLNAFLASLSKKYQASCDPGLQEVCPPLCSRHLPPAGEGLGLCCREEGEGCGRHTYIHTVE